MVINKFVIRLLIFCTAIFAIYLIFSAYNKNSTPSLSVNKATTTSPTPSNPVDQIVWNGNSCVITADTGDAGGAQIVNLTSSLQIPCLIIAGDVIYPNGSKENFTQVVEPYLQELISKQAVFPVPGNHDWWRGYPGNSRLSWTADDLPLCQIFDYLPQGQGKCRYYRLRIGDTEVFFFDSDIREPDGNNATSVQGKWLQASLAASTATWKLVVTHEPPISSCQHEGSLAVHKLPLQAWGADALITGHCHFYERSVDQGLPILTIGNGGNSLYQFTKANPNSVFRYNKGKGALKLSSTPTNLTLDFVTVNNQVLDSLSLNK